MNQLIAMDKLLYSLWFWGMWIVYWMVELSDVLVYWDYC